MTNAAKEKRKNRDQVKRGRSFGESQKEGGLHENWNHLSPTSLISAICAAGFHSANGGKVGKE